LWVGFCRKTLFPPFPAKEAAIPLKAAASQERRCCALTGSSVPLTVISRIKKGPRRSLDRKTNFNYFLRFNPANPINDEANSQAAAGIK
jgi:hypothetical protein